MMICWVVGRIAGGLAAQTVTSHIQAYKQARPLPDDQVDGGEAADQEQDANDTASAQARADVASPTTT